MSHSVKSVFPKPIYLGAATRSPIGKFGGTLKRFSAPRLATLALKEAVSRAPGAAAPDLVVLGHARQAGARPNPARQATIFAGFTDTTPAFTVNQACASGLCSIFMGLDQIALGRARSVWAGGVESMSNTPYFLLEARWGYRMGHGQLVDGMYHDGFMCPMANMVMGETVDKYLAHELNISRLEQDAYALESQKRATVAWKEGFFKSETFEIPADGKFLALREDEHYRKDATLEQLAKLPPVFDPKSGTVTAGNSSGITDGAAFVHLSDTRYDHAQAEVLDYEMVALDPRRMGLGPVPAMKKLLERHRLQVTDLEAVELNEAFAAQVLACQRELKIPADRLNAWGGGIALGHPIGSTGTRITVTLIHRLRGKKGALGAATLCVSGGQGVALLLRSLW
ncbi:MAG: thiolase family protein [Deltaproteobacteria bacterium]|nr:thiolase family protein [Deltaproteobacteria bacterium]